VPAKDRASIAALRSFAQKIVKTRQHDIVVMQDMRPVTARPLNASIPIIG